MTQQDRNDDNIRDYIISDSYPVYLVKYSRVIVGSVSLDISNKRRKRDAVESGKAEKRLNKVATYFGFDKELILKARKGKGDIGKARTLLICLLREYLPWDGSRFIRFAGLRSWGYLSYHTSMEKIKSLEVTIKILKNDLKDI